MHLYSWKLVLNFLLLVLVLATQSCLTLWPHGLHPTRLLCPWDFSGKDTRVDCHFLLQGIFPPQRSNLCLLHCRQILYRLSYKVLVLGRQLFSLVYVSVAQSCPTLCNPMACSPPGSSVHRILQARILEWVAISSFKGSSRPRNQTQVSSIICIDRWILYHWVTWEAHP